VTYEVTIRKYNKGQGRRDSYLKEVIEPTTTLTKKGIPTTQLYYKEYKKLTFDIVRSSQLVV
jgi:hypothetical protein